MPRGQKFTLRLLTSIGSSLESEPYVRWEDPIAQDQNGEASSQYVQERLAEKAGLAAGYLSQIETGADTVGEAISRISEALQMDMAEFLLRDREISSERDAWISRIVRLLEARSEADLKFAYDILARMFEHFTSYEG